jgi:hypothetical protein
LTEEDFVRARLTALAIEAEEFNREDIYTLFVTTRIVNFLKGLPLTSSVDLTDLLDRRYADSRTMIGFELLLRLAQTGGLYFWTGKGLVKNEKFGTDLFLGVLLQAGEIGCQSGAKIKVREFVGSVCPSRGFPSMARVP